MTIITTTKHNERANRSVNISLQVQPIKDVYPPILVVRVLRRDAAGCSMWTPGDKYKKPPFCCEFIYFLLCREIVPVYNLPQCPTSNANSAHSCL
ncbi:hypothetical protein V5799_002696 [Amblyomma americanum]|uniref:Uncharacterized protein n=1 Tax=Amblyomma americanum TaxID=6943 RepID=A0AAQ4DB32_AMBAM